MRIKDKIIEAEISAAEIIFQNIEFNFVKISRLKFGKKKKRSIED